MSRHVHPSASAVPESEFMAPDASGISEPPDPVQLSGRLRGQAPPTVRVISASEGVQRKAEANPAVASPDERRRAAERFEKARADHAASRERLVAAAGLKPTRNSRRMPHWPPTRMPASRLAGRPCCCASVNARRPSRRWPCAGRSNGLHVSKPSTITTAPTGMAHPICAPRCRAWINPIRPRPPAPLPHRRPTAHWPHLRGPVRRISPFIRWLRTGHPLQPRQRLDTSELSSSG